MRGRGLGKVVEKGYLNILLFKQEWDKGPWQKMGAHRGVGLGIFEQQPQVRLEVTLDQR